MKLETYFLDDACSALLISLCDPKTGWVPSAQVRHFVDESAYGIIVAVEGHRIIVLWSKEPIDFEKYSTLTNPLRRRINATEVAKNMIYVEPLPVGAQVLYTRDLDITSTSK